MIAGEGRDAEGDFSSYAQLEEAAALLDAHPGYRVLRALPPLDTLVLPAPEGKVRTALVIDTETTSLNWRNGRIIEVAACPISFDARGRVVGIGAVQSWLDDPGAPLDPEISRLTGLTDTDLTGQRIDDAAVEELLASADLILAHNARFDRPWWEARYPLARTKPWCCSLTEVGWAGYGHEGRSLGVLLVSAGGWFSPRHRADADVAALVALLTCTLPPGHSVATETILTASRPTLRVGAMHAPFAVKDRLRQRGYRWNAIERIWQIDVPVSRQDDEVAWLAAEASCTTPTLQTITWHDRHR